MSFSRPRLEPPGVATCTQPLPLRLGPWRCAMRPSEESASSRAPRSNGRVRVASAPASQQSATPSLVVTTRTGIARSEGSDLSARTHPGPSSSGFCASSRMRLGALSVALRIRSAPFCARTISQPRRLRKEASSIRNSPASSTMSTRDIGRCIAGPSIGGVHWERFDPWNSTTGRGLRPDDTIIASAQARFGYRGPQSASCPSGEPVDAARRISCARPVRRRARPSPPRPPRVVPCPAPRPP